MEARPHLGKNIGGPVLFVSVLANATAAINFESLGLDPVALDIGFFQVRWYSLAYIAGILIGWWYLLKLLAQPGAPMARRHADDLVFYATLGIILGGRLGYVAFYEPAIAHDPVNILKLWEGGMSFHGGMIGVSLAILFMVWRQRLNWLRVHDYVACCVPFGLFFGRIANFINGELFGRPTDVPWAMVFPNGGPIPRHPSQLYEAFAEGLLLFLLLWFMAHYTRAPQRPGLIAGTFLTGYGIARGTVEFFRQPDQQLGFLYSWVTMGQLLSLPLIVVGLMLIWHALSTPPSPAQPVPTRQ